MNEDREGLQRGRNTHLSGSGLGRIEVVTEVVVVGLIVRKVDIGAFDTGTSDRFDEYT